MEPAVVLPYYIGNQSQNSSAEDGSRSLLEQVNAAELQSHLPAIVYTSILMLMGTPGNCLVLYVYFFKWRKSTSRMFILFLTALDLVNCVTTLPMEIFIMRYSVMLDIPWLCKFSRFSTYTMNSSSAMILVFIAIDRFKRICRPHGHQFSAKVSKHICIASILFSFVLTWPAVVLYGTRVVNLGKTQGTSCLIENQWDITIYPYVYFIIMMSSTVVVFSVLSVLYYFVGIQVYKHRKLRMKRKSERQVSQNVVENSVESRSKQDTLLQDSDSAELKKAANAQNNTAANHVGQEMELRPLALPNTLTVSNTDLDKNSTSQSRTQSIDSANSERRARQAKRNKQRRLNKRTNLKDSLSKANGTVCINMKIRIGRSTLMLFLITIAYIISFLPFYSIAIMRQTYEDFVRQLSPSGYMAYHVFLRSYLLSSAINPIIYSFCNAQFRTFCCDAFRKDKSHRAKI